MDATFLTRRSRNGKQICVSLQFLVIGTKFLTRGLRKSKSNLRFATVWRDRHHVFDETVAREKIEICVLAVWVKSSSAQGGGPGGVL